MPVERSLPDTIEIRLGGTGGQGLILGGLILAEALVHEGWDVAHSQNFDPLSRGGSSRSDLVASKGEVDFPLVTGLHVLIILDQIAVAAAEGLLRPDALVLVDSDRVTEPPGGEFDLRALRLSAEAHALGNPRGANMVALGAMTALSGICHLESLESAIRILSPARFVAANEEALRRGYRLGIAETRHGVSVQPKSPA